MVLDSPFSSLKVLVEEIVKDKVYLLLFLLNQSIKLVKNTVKKAHFNMNHLHMFMTEIIFNFLFYF